jgi:quercetin dioxygenase-like cupin family protein
MVMEGEMEFEVDGKVHHPAPGEEFLIPAGALHSARNVGDSTARWLFGYKRR